MQAKPFSIIVAVAQNRAIGKNNDLLWHISEDLKRFKQITLGKTVIMGYNTYLSLPIRPFPKRRNIIIVDDPKICLEGCEMAYSIDEAVALADADQENFIVGGGSIYQQFLPLSQKFYLTKVLKDFDADIFFPSYSLDEWSVVEESELFVDEKSLLPYQYITYQRKYER